MSDLTIGVTNVTTLLRTKYQQLKKAGWVSLVQVPSEYHLDINIEALKLLINEMEYQCVYITLGKTSSDLEKIYKEKGVDITKLYFIDAISQMYGESQKPSKRHVFTAGPLDVDAISSNLRDILATLPGKTCVFLDSVSTVLLYNSLPRTVRFSQFLTETLRKMDVTGIMVTMAKGQMNEALVEELRRLTDEVIVVSAEGG
jgi:KaiC/GvpD/RAD55 family RecA-like ATPase